MGRSSQVPAESKQRMLAQGISEAQLPVVAGLTLVCVTLSGLAWWKLRRRDDVEA